MLPVSNSEHRSLSTTLTPKSVPSESHRGYRLDDPASPSPKLRERLDAFFNEDGFLGRSASPSALQSMLDAVAAEHRAFLAQRGATHVTPLERAVVRRRR